VVAVTEEVVVTAEVADQAATATEAVAVVTEEARPAVVEEDSRLLNHPIFKFSNFR
jgi:hypothetical protein